MCVSGLLGIGSWPHLSTTSICPRAVVSSRKFIGSDAATALCIRDASKTAGATGLVGWFWEGGSLVGRIACKSETVYFLLGAGIGENEKGQRFEVGSISSTVVCLQ